MPSFKQTQHPGIHRSQIHIENIHYSTGQYLVVSPMRPENLHPELVHLGTGWGGQGALIFGLNALIPARPVATTGGN